MTTRIVFMGSPDFAVPTLEALAENFQVVGVVTQPDRLAGRGRNQLFPPAVKSAALKLSLPIIQPASLRREPEAVERIRAWGPDVICVAAFGQILRPDVLDLPPHGCLNVHASLLPRWRGAAPINAAILHGDAETGVTIMKMDPGMDTGPILSQRAIPITENETAGTLFEKLSRLGAELLVETLPPYLSGDLQPKAQDDSLATYAPMLKKQDGELDFTEPVGYLARKVRAYNPWPGAFTTWKGQMLKVHRASAIGNDALKKPASPGRRAVYQDQPAIGAQGGLLLLERLQPAGKRAMSGEAFLHGNRDWA